MTQSLNNDLMNKSAHIWLLGKSKKYIEFFLFERFFKFLNENKNIYLD